MCRGRWRECPVTRGIPVARRNGHLGWYVSFLLIAVVAFVVVDLLTGQEALAAAARVLWNAAALIVNGVMRLLGELLGLLARGIGLRRVSRLANLVGSVGLGYTASIVLSTKCRPPASSLSPLGP